MLKAAVMNNAGHDVWTGPNQTGHAYGPARVGAGRVDALGAVNTDTIAFSPGADNPVSASFGVVPAGSTRARHQDAAADGAEHGPPGDALRAVLRPGDHPAGRELLRVAVAG